MHLQTGCMQSCERLPDLRHASFGAAGSSLCAFVNGIVPWWIRYSPLFASGYADPWGQPTEKACVTHVAGHTQRGNGNDFREV